MDVLSSLFPSRKRGQVATSTTDLITFGISDLEVNPDDPNSFIGKGGFGRVYQGTIRGRQERNLNGVKVAVKVSQNKNDLRTHQFNAEVNYLPGFNHDNIIKLIGYCQTPNKFYLVYPYMENGSVTRNLSGLDWKKTLKIIKGTASAIQNLHCHSPPLIYGDLKPDNILLDKDYNPKLADFGTVREKGVDLICGTDGYTDPAIMSAGQGDESSDIYSLGVVSLQLITKKPKVSDGNWYLVNSTRIEMNCSIRKGCSRSAAESITELAMACVKPNTRERPTIGEVIKTLRGLK